MKPSVMKRDLSSLDDHALVDLLLANDHGAWEHVLLGAALRIASGRKFKEMLAQTGHDPMEAITELCKNLYADGFARLRAFEFRGSFDAWLFWEVRTAVDAVAGLGDREREIPTDPADPAGAIAPAMQPTAAEGVRDRFRDARTLFVRLWSESPAKAYALFMRGELGMPTKEIAVLLGQKPNSVDQMVKRARARMEELERETETGGVG